MTSDILGEKNEWEMFLENDSSPEQETTWHHTETGIRITNPLRLPAEVCQIISFHHEWFDGSKSPHGLFGNGIPYNAQIVSIANFFDHLRMERPAKPALTIDESLNELHGLAETRFNPILVNAFIKVIQTSSPPQ